MEQKNIKYPKTEKLKSKIIISQMFTTGKSISKYPLRMVYIPIANKENVPLKTGVSVSKRYFKRSVDRNYFKRLLRESYRLNKHLLLDTISEPHAIMIFYQTKDKLSFVEINEKMVELFKKFTVENYRQ